MSLPQHLKTGLRGEQLAARHLRKHGYKVLAANFASGTGETDIIAMKRRTLCFIEVKTRSPGGMFPPAQAVSYEKQDRLINNAAAFLKRSGISCREIRFDIIEVVLHSLTSADINHIENAFGQGELDAEAYFRQNRGLK